MLMTISGNFNLLEKKSTSVNKSTEIKIFQPLIFFLNDYGISS